MFKSLSSYITLNFLFYKSIKCNVYRLFRRLHIIHPTLYLNLRDSKNVTA